MFDVSWQEILVIGVVALIVVGPKELPTLLRTVGKYVGAIKRQASEFRAQFDEAMRESELDQIRKDVEKIKTDTEDALRNVEQSVDTHISGAKRELDDATNSISGGRNHPDAHDANGLPFPVDDQGQLPPGAPSPPGDETPSTAPATAIAQNGNDQAADQPSAAQDVPDTPPASPSPGSSSNPSGTSPAKANA